MPIVNLNTFDELGELANKHEWLLLDFWAPWCAPCKVMNPVLEQFSELNPDNAVIKVDVDQKHEIAAKFGGQGDSRLWFYSDAISLWGRRPGPSL